MINANVFRFDSDDLATQDIMSEFQTPRSLNDVNSAQYINHKLRQIDQRLINLAKKYGTPYGFEAEQNGAIVQNLFPIQANSNKQISSSSSVDLEMHTETAFHSLRPDILVLLCIREDKAAGTTVSKLDNFLPLLDQDIISILHENLFQTTIDLSFSSNDDKTLPTVDTPVLFNNASEITFDRVLMTGKTPEAAEALSLLSKAIQSVTEVIYLKTGEGLIINNKTIIHGRTSFSPRFDGTDRWIKRVMVRHSLPNKNTKLDADGYRVVTTRF